ncbi:MAG: 2,3-bisphosphoglycerate-dependent phosphoglycerate mutase [Solirubrobacterales bacterium]|jgi:broad specificity phosphatase PhoE|nr:2,3-bisphosphoglycerate-dependent phosphoglycerate mutase [Solirubrobacterales bacterium]
MQALLLRHGESVSNADPEAIALPAETGDRLSERGRQQAAAAAQALLGIGITRLLSSPMHRALETAEPVSEALDLPVTVLPYVHELKESAGYGRLSAEEQKLRRWSARMSAHLDDPNHSSDGAESFNEIVSRVRLLKAELESQPEGEKALIVTHGIFSRFFCFDSLLGEAFEPRMVPRLWNLRTRNCGLSVFEHGERWHPADVETPDWTCITWMAQPWNPP